MGTIKIISLFSTLLTMNVSLLAQKQTFGVVSYSALKGWQQQQNEGGVQLSVSDKKTGAYALAIITKATASEAGANENFNTDWIRLVKSTVQVDANPTMLSPAKTNGWDIISGNANYTDGSNKGLATLLTATGSGQMVSVVIMTNTQQYQKELHSFINSLELVKATAAATGNKTSAGTNKGKGSPVAGLWTNYVLETTGCNINGMPQYTAGYLRKEYHFYPDGTYLFRNKQWLVKAPNIVFQYETGTYTVSDNQLTLTPDKGKGGFWKKTNSSKEWGSLIKYSESKLETTTYTFQIIIDPTYGNSIVLKSSKPTQRDGGQFNAPGDPYEFRYSFRELESSIDNPPGLKTGFENKSLTVVTKKDAATTLWSPITGKIWQGTTKEKFSHAGGTSYNAGGFATNQYKFNADGTYRFISVTASHYTDTKTLNYETGTYYKWKPTHHYSFKRI